MEWNPETLQFLSQCFLHTLSPQPEPRHAAESSLAEAADRPNYGLAVLRLVAEPSVDEQIRQAAAVNFKNHLRTRWVPSNDLNAGPTFSPILDPEKDQIKTLIVSLMLSSSPRIQSQLSEALAVIGKHDFPKSWPTLLPELISNLQKAAQSSDYASINGILGTANSIFKKFRYQYKTNDLLLDLKYCLDNFAAPLLDIFLKTASLIDSTASSPGGGSPATLQPLFESQRLCCRIFYSLNFQELPEFFEDHMKEWMGEFRKYLTTNYPSLESSGDGLALVDQLRAAVCENISLYMEKNEEEFQGYLNDFASAVWSLLTNVSQSSSRDKLAVTAMKFLTTVSTSVHHTLFASEGVIPQICESIVIPNVRLRDEDEELFEMNYIEFIRRDMEGSDLDTRRRIACELLKGIATNYKKKVTDIVSLQIQNLLISFATNPSANWKDKDCAIYLVVSLATKKAGGTLVSTDLVDVQSFFLSVIVPELQSQDVNGFPMLKAGALKFFTTFRGLIQKPVAFQLFPDLVRFLGAESNVVHSYAASCIEKLLLVKDEGGKARYTSADITPCVPVLMNNLFNSLKFPESEENQYIMKCILRVLAVADISSEIAGPCIAGLTSILNEVCKNPRNPIFNHYLFESVAILIRRACERDASLISAFEGSLFPSLQTILANDVTEFLPYAFQLLAQLVELNKPPISPRAVIAFLLFIALASASVVVLNPDNINQVLQDNDAHGVLVKFYAPWCGHCKNIAPEYEAAAVTLAESGVKAVLAEADCDAHRSIGEEYGITGYPTLKFFKDGVVSAYNGGRTRNEIVSWIKRNSATTLEAVETAEALAALKPTGNIYGLVVLFGENKDLNEAFLVGARTLEDIQFVQVTSSDLIAAEKATAGSARLYKQDGSSLDLPATAEGILKVVTKNVYPKIVEFSQPQFQRLAGSTDLVILGFAPYEDTAKVSELKSLLEKAADANENVGFLYGDSGVFARGLSGAGASMNFLPTVVAIQSSQGQFVWDEETPLNAETLQVWIGQVFAGNPPTNKKSEAVPEDNNGPVVKLVYKNYNEYFAKGTPIFVKYYAPWCGHCKNMQPDWVKLGETVNKENVIIAEYDSTANYAEVERVEGFPTLVFYDGQGGKEVYQGERSYDALLAFVNSKVAAAPAHGHSHDEL